MNGMEMQQIIVSGVGGQGVLFITKLLAETALDLDYSVLISETHGMAQRGGNVISHLKVCKRVEKTEEEQRGRKRSTLSQFTSPLVRPGCADVLLALHPDGVAMHAFYLRHDGRTFCNAKDLDQATCIDAARFAAALGSPISANLVFLGFATGLGSLFCPAEEIEKVLKRYGGKRVEMNLKAFHAGWEEALRRR